MRRCAPGGRQRRAGRVPSDIPFRGALAPRLPGPRRRPRFLGLIRRLGPGLVTGAADDDPSGIVTYAQAGAAFGYGLGWAVVLTLPFMVAVQEISARIGRVTGLGLVGALRAHAPRPVLLALVWLLVVANVVNLGADIGGMADVSRMLLGGPAWGWAGVIAVFCAVTEIWVAYKRYVVFLKFLTLALLAYVALLFVIEVPWLTVLKNVLLPRVALTRDALMMLVGVLGTTISPYLFVWQAAEEVEDALGSADPRPLRGRGAVAAPDGGAAGGTSDGAAGGAAGGMAREAPGDMPGNASGDVSGGAPGGAGKRGAPVPAAGSQAATRAEKENAADAADGAGEIARIGFDTWSGMSYSNAVSLSIIVGTAATLHAHGITTIDTASQAAVALAPIAGRFAALIFSLGVIGTGLLAVPGPGRGDRLCAGRGAGMAGRPRPAADGRAGLLWHHCRRHPGWRRDRAVTDQPDAGAGPGRGAQRHGGGAGDRGDGGAGVDALGDGRLRAAALAAGPGVGHGGTDGGRDRRHAGAVAHGKRGSVACEAAEP